MSFVDAVKSFFNNYAKFSGRARRSEFWYAQLFVNLAALICFFIDVTLFSSTLSASGGGIITGIFVLAIIVPSLAVLVRRLHDTDKSGWYALISLIPLVGNIILFVFLVQDSTPANQYGVSDKVI